MNDHDINGFHHLDAAGVCGSATRIKSLLHIAGRAIVTVSRHIDSDDDGTGTPSDRARVVGYRETPRRRGAYRRFDTASMAGRARPG